MQYLKETTVEEHIETRLYQTHLLHKEFAHPLHVVIIAQTNLRTQASTFGASSTTVQTRQDFTKNMINTLQTGADALTLADFTVVAPLFLAERAKLPLEKYANIKAWFGRQAALPAWQQTAPK